jgi:hypothetical protein
MNFPPVKITFAMILRRRLSLEHAAAAYPWLAHERGSAG